MAPSEKFKAERFANWLSERMGETYRVTEARNPPDALLESKSHRIWLEIIDVFLSNEQAKFLNTAVMLTEAKHLKPVLRRIESEMIRDFSLRLE